MSIAGPAIYTFLLRVPSEVFPGRGRGIRKEIFRSEKARENRTGSRVYFFLQRVYPGSRRLLQRERYCVQRR